MACRWMNVPRRVSCPASRTARPSSTSAPNAYSSAVAQSTLPELAIATRRSICGFSRGCRVKPSGGFAYASAMRLIMSSGTAVVTCWDGVSLLDVGFAARPCRWRCGSRRTHAALARLGPIGA